MRWLAAMPVLLWATAATAEMRSLPVLSVTLYPGDAISGGMLVDKQFTGTAKVFSGYILDAQELEGKFARRTLVAGLPIARAAVKDRDVVFQGTPAAAVFEAGGLSIQTTLLPLESGAAGQPVRARNPDSGLTVMAVAQADGTLRVGPE
jgi:flagellar basal body P-ring formation protein FlgA